MNGTNRHLKTLLKQYGLSYRLVKMMCTDPVIQTQTAVAKADALGGTISTENVEDKPGGTTPADDIEGAYHLEKLDPVAASSEVASLGHLSFSSIINQIWHFCSVDYGPKCVFRFQDLWSNAD
jgi:hypothetical protein